MLISIRKAQFRKHIIIWAQEILRKLKNCFLKEAEFSNNLRAQLGLAFLYNIETKYDKEWQYYSEVIKHADKPDMYLLAEIDGLAIARNIKDDKSGIIELIMKRLQIKVTVI